MAQLQAQRSQCSERPGARGPAPSTPVTDVLDAPEEGESFLRLNCTTCAACFVLDVEEWRAAPDESEMTGREFLGIPNDATLCPHCLRRVQLAGAEHIYWRIANF